MSADYCDLCDLPKSTCIHGMPPKPPEPVKQAAPRRTSSPRKAPAPRKATAPRKASGPAVATRKVSRRWTPPEVFAPLIVDLLRDAGGAMSADDVFRELELLAGESFLSGDRETTPEGELRWRYAARRARQALINDGVMTKGAPGVWQLA